jgi:hypothetical protein
MGRKAEQDPPNADAIPDSLKTGLPIQRAFLSNRFRNDAPIRPLVSHSSNGVALGHLPLSQLVLGGTL